MKTLLATAFAALTIAAPAQAYEPTPLDRFVWARALSICLIEAGRSTISEMVDQEIKWLAKNGITLEQYKNFNSAANSDEWIGKRVKTVIAEDGGCPGVLSIIDKPEPAPKPMPTTRPAYLY